MKQFLIATTMILSAMSVSAQQPAMAPIDSITVSGSGKSTLTPDRFTFSVGVQTAGPTVEQAVNENNAKVNAVLAALKKAGATEKEVRTANFSVWPQQDYREGSTPRILGYQVSNSVSVTRDKIGEAGKLLQVAISAGVNTATGLSFEVSDPSRGRDAGLRAAFDDARAKAALLAQAAGRSLGPALMISEGGAAPVYPYPQPRAMAMKSEAAVSEVPVEAGTQEQSYGVTVTFALR